MGWISKPKRQMLRTVASALLAVLCGRGAFAAPPATHSTVLTAVPFEEATWQRLLTQGPRPAAYVFTTTYCPSCPEAFDKLRTHIASTQKSTPSVKPVELVVVLMDVQGTQAVQHARYYAGATRLYAFEGFEAAIRQSIDPHWPNVTPYVVLLGKDGSIQRSMGAPAPQALKKWPI